MLIGKQPVACSLEDWASRFEENKRVASDEVGPLYVSTVFLGLDHRFFGDGDPLLFETMIFGDLEDSYQTRCSTWVQAEQMHAEAVAYAKEQVAKADEVIKQRNPHEQGN
jgi:hypothetical protein